MIRAHARAAVDGLLETIRGLSRALDEAPALLTVPPTEARPPMGVDTRSQCDSRFPAPEYVRSVASVPVRG